MCKFMNTVLLFYEMATYMPIWFELDLIWTLATKNLEEKDGQRQVLQYVSLIRACNKVLYQLVYIGKKFVSRKKNLGI